jgi:Protein of unknown function (DUF3619)
MDTTGKPLTPAQVEALEARFALRLTARLDDSSESLGHEVSERLRVARMQAVAAARHARATQHVVAPATAPLRAPQWQLASAPSAGSPGFGRHIDHGRRLDDKPTGWGWRIASALPIIALVAGLWGIHWWQRQQQVDAAADIDMALLADDLPPAAYADPAFEEFLRAGSPLPAVMPAEDALTQGADTPSDAGERTETDEPATETTES